MAAASDVVNENVLGWKLSWLLWPDPGQASFGQVQGSLGKSRAKPGQGQGGARAEPGHTVSSRWQGLVLS